MDKKKQNKDKKIGADGLTKKERRALKVQGRQTDDNKAELKNVGINTPQNNPQKDDSNKKKKSEMCVEERKDEFSDGNISLIESVKSLEKSGNELKDKEKIKSDWEKKLTEQKNHQNKSDSKADGLGLSKAQQRSKRREIQEMQRLVKSKTDLENNKETVLGIDMKRVDSKISTKPELTKHKKVYIRKAPHSKKLLHGSKVELLHHLYLGDSKNFDLEDSVSLPNIHPAFVQLGVQYLTKTIMGSNARCVSLLLALNNLVGDLRIPPEQEFCRYLESVLQNSTDYLQKCRPMAVSMTNALRLFKLQLTQIDTNIPDDDKKEKLLEFISTYITDQIRTAGTAISMKVFEKISNGDSILIYGCSSLIKQILVDAFLRKKQFKIIVVDSRPLLEGREMLRRLTEAGIECTYILINALGYVMSTVTKVLLGAHALLTNGYVMSRTGTAQVALVAQAYNKPVLVCCETYKFSERVQTDSLVYNEIGDPDSLLKIDSSDQSSPLNAWRENNKLTPLNILYDVTPPDLVTAVVTELAILPCTSVPVVLRIKPTEIY